MFGPDSVPVAGVIPGVTCVWYLQFFPVYCGPQYVGPVVVYVFPVPQSPFVRSVYPVGHVFLTTVELVDVEQLEESVGIGKYPGGHVGTTVSGAFAKHRPETSIVNPDGQIFRTVTADPVGRRHLVLSTGNST